MPHGLRFVVLTTSYPAFEGDFAGHFVQAEARALVAAGREVHVLAAGGRLSDAPRRDGGVTVWRCGGGDNFAAPGIAARLGEAPWRVAVLPRLAWGVHRRLRSLGSCDELHAHWLLPCGWPLAALAQASKCYAIAHGADVRLLLGLPQDARVWLLRRLLNNCTTLRFVANALREELCASLPLALADELRRRSTVAACAIEVTQVSSAAEVRAQFGVEAERPFIVWVGRLIEDKRAELLLEALAKMADPPLCLLVGAGPVRVNIEELIERLQLPVKLLGALPRQTTLDVIAAAEVLVSCSRHEGAPTVVREARALGTPVVATAAGDVARWAALDDGIWLTESSPIGLGETLAKALGRR